MSETAAVMRKAAKSLVMEVRPDHQVRVAVAIHINALLSSHDSFEYRWLGFVIRLAHTNTSRSASILPVVSFCECFWDQMKGANMCCP